MELLDKLGIDWKSLIAQIVNFLVLLLVLYKFAFKPLIKLLDERSSSIEKSLANAKKIEKNLEESNKAREEVILNARGEAQNILTQAKKDADSGRQKLLADAHDEVAKLLESGRSQLARDHEKIKKELQEEVAELVVEATRKVLAGTVTEKVNREYVNKILRPPKTT